MKKGFVVLLLNMMTLVYGQASNIPFERADSVKVCKGHGLTERILGDFQLAKSTKEKWDEQTPYDRTIKNCESDMYKEDNWWVIEYDWIHVDDCPKCNNYVVMDLS